MTLVKRKMSCLPNLKADGQPILTRPFGERGNRSSNMFLQCMAARN